MSGSGTPGLHKVNFQYREKGLTLEASYRVKGSGKFDQKFETLHRCCKVGIMANVSRRRVRGAGTWAIGCGGLCSGDRGVRGRAYKHYTIKGDSYGKEKNARA
jgi:hypothetical protein